MFGSQASTIILALALVVTLSVGEFDLSVASTLGLSATLVAVLNGQDHWSIVIVVIVAMLSGVAVGVANGLLVVFLGVDGIVVTLGMATFLLGLAIWVSHQEAIGGVSVGLGHLMLRPILGLNAAFIYAIVITAIIWYVLRRTPLGRHMLFVGHNREVARLVGAPVNRIRFGAFVFGGLISAIAGVVTVGLSGGFLADSAQTLLLPAFAAAFLGAAVVVPGRFNAWGTLIAILFLITGITGLELLGLTGTAWISQIFYGGALIVAVSVSHLLGRGRAAAGAL
jgi:ribose transport system permease protein